MALISVTLLTSHSPIGPCGPLEQSLSSWDSPRHASTAPLSSVLDCGENAVVGWGRIVGPSCKVDRDRTEGWQREVQRLQRIWQVVHLRAHHYKNSATRRQGTLGTRSKDANINESVHVGGSLCFCFCRVLLCLFTCNCE